MTTGIIQFGTSRFLQAHADLVAHEARDGDLAIGPIPVVQTSGPRERAARVRAFGHPEGYPVILRGLEEGSVAFGLMVEPEPNSPDPQGASAATWRRRCGLCSMLYVCPSPD